MPVLADILDFDHIFNYINRQNYQSNHKNMQI